MCELITARTAVAGHGAHLYHGAVCVTLYLYGQETLGWAGGAVELQRIDCVIAHELCLLDGIDGQDNLADTQVERLFDDLCRHWKAFHDAWLKCTDLAYE